MAWSIISFSIHCKFLILIMRKKHSKQARICLFRANWNWNKCICHNNKNLSLREKGPYRIYSGPHFLAFGMNTDISLFSVRMRENLDHNNSEYGYFLRSARLTEILYESKRIQYEHILGHFVGVFFIGIHPMQGWTATTRHGVTRKKSSKKITGYRKSV